VDEVGLFDGERIDQVRQVDQATSKASEGWTKMQLNPAISIGADKERGNVRNIRRSTGFQNR
jgi:hypothetical protein